MSATEEEMIRCEGLRKTYGTFAALRGLDLRVPARSIVGLLGPNGAGKSTTIKLLTRQIAPSGGQAWVAGMPVSGRTSDVRSRIGYLSEQPAFYTWMSGAEFLDFTGELFRMSPKERRARRDELLELVGLTGAAKRKIGGYSNGMRQRLGIAQALVNRPEVLFLDEPVSALDPLGRKEVLELLASLKGACTIFFSSHILADVDRVCDQVAVLHKGELLAQAPTRQLKERYAQPQISVELEGEADIVRDILKDARYVQKIEIEGSRAIVQVNDLALAMLNLPASLVQAQLSLLRYEVALPSLEDVFMRLIEDEDAQNGGTH